MALDKVQYICAQLHGIIRTLLSKNRKRRNCQSFQCTKISIVFKKKDQKSDTDSMYFPEDSSRFTARETYRDIILHISHYFKFNTLVLIKYNSVKLSNNFTHYLVSHNPNWTRNTYNLSSVSRKSQRSMKFINLGIHVVNHFIPRLHLYSDIGIT